MISSSSRKGSFGIFSNVRHLIVLDIASTLTSVIYGTELKKITVGRLFPNFIRGKEKNKMNIIKILYTIMSENTKDTVLGLYSVSDFFTQSTIPSQSFSGITHSVSASEQFCVE